MMGTENSQVFFFSNFFFFFGEKRYNVREWQSQKMKEAHIYEHVFLFWLMYSASLS